MSCPTRILFKILVKPFYRENKGFFVFLFTMMFYIVGTVDGAGLFAYHYSLILGMLKSNSFLLLVFVLWALYTGKFVVFITQVLHKPQYSFLHVYHCLGRAKLFWLFLLVGAGLLMPVLLYAMLIVVIGFWRHFYLPASFVLLYLFLLCGASAAWHVYRLHHPDKKGAVATKKPRTRSSLLSSYAFLLIRFVASRQKVIWGGIKVYTCGVLYLIARNNSLAEYDMAFAFLFFNFGILANGILVYRVREFEETYLAIYRALPVSLLKRWLHYAALYAVFLIPEALTAGILAPVHLQYGDALRFMLCGCSLLLLMNTILFFQDFSRKAYLKILLLLFCVQYVFLLTAGLTCLFLFFFTLSIAGFFMAYYKFERHPSASDIGMVS